MREQGGRAEIDSFADRVRSDPGVEFVPPPQINQPGDAAIITVIPTTSPQDKETEDLVAGCATTSSPRRSARPASAPASGA